MGISSIVNEQKSYFYKGHTRNIEERKQHLKRFMKEFSVLNLIFFKR